MESRALAAVIIAVMQRRARHPTAGSASRALRSISGRARDILAVEMQKIEDEEDQPGRVAGIRRGLDHAEGGDAVREDAAQLAVEIGLTRAERRHGRGDRRIFMRPVEPGAGQQSHRAMIEPRMHAVAVEFDFVQPLIAFGRRVDELGELRRDPLPAERPRRCAGALTAAPCRERRGCCAGACDPLRPGKLWWPAIAVGCQFR